MYIELKYRQIYEEANVSDKCDSGEKYLYLSAILYIFHFLRLKSNWRVKIVLNIRIVFSTTVRFLQVFEKKDWNSKSV